MVSVVFGTLLASATKPRLEPGAGVAAPAEANIPVNAVTARPIAATAPARTGRDSTPTKPPLWFGPRAVYKICECSISERKCTLTWRVGRKFVTTSLLCVLWGFASVTFWRAVGCGQDGGAHQQTG